MTSAITIVVQAGYALWAASIFAGAAVLAWDGRMLAGDGERTLHQRVYASAVAQAAIRITTVLVLAVLASIALLVSVEALT